MARLSIEDLPMPADFFRPSRMSRHFETKESTVEEDKLRIRRINMLLSRPDRLEAPLEADALRELRRSILDASTPASSIYMRKQRNQIAGNLWKAIANQPEDFSTFTLIPSSWEISGGCLDKVDPRALIEQLRRSINRAGFNRKDGWLFAAIHGEHEPNEDLFVFHVHGGAFGSARAAVDELRKQCRFHPRRSSPKERVARRVRMSRKTLGSLPDPLTYIVQSFWPERAAFENAAGERKRQRDKRRIEEPRHTEVLLWLDRWRLRDTCLLMGIQVTRDGFRTSPEMYTNGDAS